MLFLINIFVNIVPNMGKANNHNLLSNTETFDDPLEKIIDKYKNHFSITCTDKQMTNSELTFTSQSVINQIRKLLNNRKIVQSTDIPTKLIKESCDFFLEFI